MSDNGCQVMPFGVEAADRSFVIITLSWCSSCVLFCPSVPVARRDGQLVLLSNAGRFSELAHQNWARGRVLFQTYFPYLLSTGGGRKTTEDFSIPGARVLLSNLRQQARAGARAQWQELWPKLWRRLEPGQCQICLPWKDSKQPFA